MVLIVQYLKWFDICVLRCIYILYITGYEEERTEKRDKIFLKKIMKLNLSKTFTLSLSEAEKHRNSLSLIGF